MNVNNDKKDLRHKLRMALTLIPSEQRDKFSRRLSENLLTIINKFAIQNDLPVENLNIGGYAPLEFEADWGEALTNKQLKLCFPCPKNEACGSYGDAKMLYRQCSLSNLVITEGFGVPVKVPPSTCNEVTPDILIIPGLGFGVQGERLGRGKGYFDSYLDSFAGLKIGVCYHVQVVSGILMEEHDQSMDVVVTDRQIIEINGLD